MTNAMYDLGFTAGVAHERHLQKDLEQSELSFERARSARLLEVLKAAYLSSDPLRTYTDVSLAIAEYEAGHE